MRAGRYLLRRRLPGSGAWVCLVVDADGLGNGEQRIVSAARLFALLTRAASKETT